VEELRGQPVRVLVARSGIEVVSYLFPRGDGHALRPTLMVLSATLPGYNGLSVLAGVRSLGWRTPVVMTWPASDEWVVDEALRLGCSGIFAEPYDPRGLAAKVMQIAGTSARSETVVAGPTRGTAA
jgi:DNA-binding response OmpR family regulator